MERTAVRGAPHSWERAATSALVFFSLCFFFAAPTAGRVSSKGVNCSAVTAAGQTVSCWVIENKYGCEKIWPSDLTVSESVSESIPDVYLVPARPEAVGNSVARSVQYRGLLTRWTAHVSDSLLGYRLTFTSDSNSSVFRCFKVDFSSTAAGSVVQLNYTLGKLSHNENVNVTLQTIFSGGIVSNGKSVANIQSPPSGLKFSCESAPSKISFVKYELDRISTVVVTVRVLPNFYEVHGYTMALMEHSSVQGESKGHLSRAEPFTVDRASFIPNSHRPVVSVRMTNIYPGVFKIMVTPISNRLGSEFMCNTLLGWDKRWPAVYDNDLWIVMSRDKRVEFVPTSVTSATSKPVSSNTLQTPPDSVPVRPDEVTSQRRAMEEKGFDVNFVAPVILLIALVIVCIAAFAVVLRRRGKAVLFRSAPVTTRYIDGHEKDDISLPGIFGDRLPILLLFSPDDDVHTEAVRQLISILREYALIDTAVYQRKSCGSNIGSWIDKPAIQNRRVVIVQSKGAYRRLEAFRDKKVIPRLEAGDLVDEKEQFGAFLQAMHKICNIGGCPSNSRQKTGHPSSANDTKRSSIVSISFNYTPKKFFLPDKWLGSKVINFEFPEVLEDMVLELKGGERTDIANPLAGGKIAIQRLEDYIAKAMKLKRTKPTPVSQPFLNLPPDSGIGLGQPTAPPGRVSALNDTSEEVRISRNAREEKINDEINDEMDADDEEKEKEVFDKITVRNLNVHMSRSYTIPSTYGIDGLDSLPCHEHTLDNCLFYNCALDTESPYCYDHAGYRTGMQTVSPPPAPGFLPQENVRQPVFQPPMNCLCGEGAFYNAAPTHCTPISYAGAATTQSHFYPVPKCHEVPDTHTPPVHFIEPVLDRSQELFVPPRQDTDGDSLATRSELCVRIQQINEYNPCCHDGSSKVRSHQYEDNPYEEAPLRNDVVSDGTFVYSPADNIFLTQRDNFGYNSEGCGALRKLSDSISLTSLESGLEESLHYRLKGLPSVKEYPTSVYSSYDYNEYESSLALGSDGN